MKKTVAIVLFILTAAMAFSETDESMVIKEILFKNLKEIPEEILKEKMNLKKGEVFSTNKMKSDYTLIKEMKYIEDVLINPEVSDGKLAVSVDIKEKEDVKELLKEDNIVPMSERTGNESETIIKAIEIYGCKNISQEEIKAKLKINVGGAFSKEKVLEGRDEILKMGYFRDVSPDAFMHEGGIYIKYSVLENPVITGIDLTGNKIMKSEQLLEGLGTKIGKMYNTDTLREDADKIMKKYQEKGYVLAAIEDMRLDEKSRLKITVSEGVVSKIEFRGAEQKDEKSVVKELNENEELKESKLKTQNYIIEREIELKTGEVFELEKFQKSVKNIFRLGYFKSINQEIKKDPENPDKIILVLVIDENKSGSIQGAVSYGSEAGIVGTFSVQDHNFRGRAQNLGISVEASSKNKKKYELSYSDPWIKGTKRLSFGASIYRKEIEDNSEEKTKYVTKTGISGNIGKGLTRSLRIRLGSRLEKIKLRIDDEVPNLENENSADDEMGSIKIENKSVEDYMTLVLLPAIYFDTRDNYLNAIKGSYVKLGFEFGRIFDQKIYNEKYADSKGKDYYKIAELEFRTFHKLFPVSKKKNLYDTMAYRAMFGVADKNTPEELWFYVGGGDTIRGISDEKGRYQFVANIENRLKVEDNIQFIFFFDTGKTWQNSSDIKNEKLKMSYGIGLRADTPLGPMRFDYGWPIGEEDKKGKFYFNIGQMF
jgi:outer membrane protein insertion porin family